MAPVITVNSIRKRFDTFEAVAGVSFSVAKGRIFGLVGADGAGKTTLIRILTTLLNPDEGEGSILDHSLRRQTWIRAHIGYMPQQFSLYGDLSVGENISFFADVFGVGGRERKERISKLLSFSRLTLFTGRPASKLSGGMKQKLALCCALVHTPQILLLDEPTTGVDPVSRREFWEILRTLRSEGITILVSTPYMDEACWCDELLFMHQGRVLCSGTPSELLSFFPSRVFRVTGSDEERLLYCASDAVLPEGIERCYPSGGALHIITKDKAVAPDLLLEHIRAIVPEACTIKQHPPEMEDLFFHHIVSCEHETAADKTA